MASTSPSSPDTPVTLKVNFDGVTRRFKLPLRELGANILETKLRSLLSVSEDTECLFERYSDSAGAYVVLDRDNVSIYKQLYRAAKAKQKLKLRITTVDTSPTSAEVKSETAAPVQPAALASSSRAPTQIQSIPRVQQDKQTLERLSASLAAMHHKTMPIRSVSHTRNPETAEAPASVQSVNSQAGTPAGPYTHFAVECNGCVKIIPDAHYHCSTCDDGDFDLCQDCVDQGITCYGSEHWLLKRFVKDGVVVNSTTETIAPKPRATASAEKRTASQSSAESQMSSLIPGLDSYLYQNMRTCNSCVQELPDHQFIHCTICPDFDLCKDCFARDQHGHHPNHRFVPAVDGTVFSHEIGQRLAPGRNQAHNAICDGCDRPIFGIRHKCLDCPDWDYCDFCVLNASFVHPDHRFVKVYEPLEPAIHIRTRAFSRPTHVGICCDGPLCNSGALRSQYIMGDRYKCAVCYDTDFCANCEASPANTHNKTHPLIKFKTPVKHVSVTTTGEHENGRPMLPMGDYVPPSTNSAAEDDVMEYVRSDGSRAVVMAFTDVQEEEKAETKQEEAKTAEPIPAEPKPLSAEDLVAVFKRDTISDGTVLPPNHVFEQTWVLRNEGSVAWPAGCSVRFVGGDYMGHVDSSHPAGVEELISASESTVCYKSLAPGEEFAFTVLLRTPPREGKFISYWRLSTEDGLKFGHRLWCDVNIQAPKIVKSEPAEKAAVEEHEEAESTPAEPQESQMIFPKLEKESPESSIHEEPKRQTAASRDGGYDESTEGDEWAEDESDDGFLTDEEYDILDASDEEYLEDQEKKLRMK